MLLTQFTSRASAEMAAPAAAVFAALTDVERLPTWNARIDRVVEPWPHPMALDATWVVQMKIPSPPATWPSRARCTAYDAQRRTFGHVSVTDDGNPSFVDWSWAVVPSGPDTSRVDVSWTVNPRTFWRRLLLARLRRAQLPREVAASLQELSGRLASERRTVA